MLVPLLGRPRADFARSKDEEMVLGEIGPGDPKTRVRDEGTEASDDELPLRRTPKRFEGAIELLPATSQRANALLGDRHVRLEGAWGHARVMVVVNANPVLVLRLPIREQSRLAGRLSVDMSEKGIDEGASHGAVRLVGSLSLCLTRQGLSGMEQKRSHAVENLISQGTFAHLWKGGGGCRVHQRCAIGVATESFIGFIRDDEVSSLFLELLSRCVLEVFGFERESNQHRGPLRSLGTQVGQDVGVADELELETATFFDLPTGT